MKSSISRGWKVSKISGAIQDRHHRLIDNYKKLYKVRAGVV
jgi:hypothetical protein